MYAMDAIQLNAVNDATAFQSYKAAKVIQKYIRGFITRKYIRRLHHYATIIQKTWRGYKSRNTIVEYVMMKYCESRNQYYNDMAAIIQRKWKLYKDPKIKFRNVHLLPLEEIYLANRLAVLRMQKFHDTDIALRESEELNIKIRWLNYALPKLHHLIRTKAIPGIYSRKDGSLQLSTVETLLASYEFKNFMNELKVERRIFLQMLQAAGFLEQSFRNERKSSCATDM